MQGCYLTVIEVAAFLRVAPNTVRGWIKKGIIPAKRWGKSYFIDHDLIVSNSASAQDGKTSEVAAILEAENARLEKRITSV